MLSFDKYRGTNWVICFTLLCFIISGGCKSTEKVKEKNEEIEYEFLCSSSEYLQTSDYFRVHKIGKSVDQPTSMKKAIQLAQKELAGNIKSILNLTIENYYHTNRILYDELLRERIIEITEMVGEESAHKVNIICEETIKTLNGLYQTYVVLDISASEVINELQKMISEDTKLQVEIDRSEFDRFFEMEMNKLIEKPLSE